MAKKNTKKTPPAPISAPQPQAVPVGAEQPTVPASGPAVQKALPPLPKWQRWAVPALMVLFFICSCLSTISTIKPLAMTGLIAAILCCFVRMGYLRDRLSLPMAAVSLWVLMNGISTLYAVSGTFALREFLKLVLGFCVFLFILTWSRKGEGSGRSAAAILEGSTALAALVSIDMISTHLLSGPLFAFLKLFSTDYNSIEPDPIEVGVRIKSLYENPNVFAGIVGLGVLLSLGSAVTSRRKGERQFHLVCLFLNALAFILAFSMGASGMIALAFLVLLLLERPSRKASLLFLMAETLVLALLCAFPIFATSFEAWSGFQPIPLLCAVAGSVLLCVSDKFIGQKFSAVLRDKSKVLTAIILAFLALMALFALLAFQLTGPAHLANGDSLRRSDYPKAGTYTLEVTSSAPVQVTIESQNQQETMMHTSTRLYSGDAQGAVFTVPEDSKVVYFNFRASSDLLLESASYSGQNGSGSLKLHYKLLPGFVANRLQGLFANQNAIQRTVFFADGMKLFARSPIYGLGMGAYENGILSVQSFFYETKYAHNHYIEALVTTGAVGFVLFVGMLVLCAAALLKNLRRREEADPLAPALAAALVFMAGHAGVEVVFNFCYYLPVALGVLALICLCCGKELPLLSGREDARSWTVIGITIPLIAFTVLLALNMQMASKINNRNYSDPYAALEQAAKLDKYEWSSYLISYVYAARNIDPTQNSTVYNKAGKYAQRLWQVNSNTIPIYLAEYYFAVDQPENAIAVLEKYVDYRASDSNAWQSAFRMLQDKLSDTPEHRQAVLALYQKLLDWDEAHIGSLTLTAANQSYIDSLR